MVELPSNNDESRKKQLSKLAVVTKRTKVGMGKNMKLDKYRTCVFVAIMCRPLICVFYTYAASNNRIYEYISEQIIFSLMINFSIEGRVFCSSVILVLVSIL